MRIGIDVRLWNQTGVGRYIRNLVLNISVIDKNNQYILFARDGDLNDVKKAISNKNFQVVQTKIPWHSISEQLNFPKILNKENLSLMHFPYFSVPIFYNKPYILTIHDLIIDHYPTGNASTLFTPLYYLKLFFYKLVIRISSQKAKMILVPSNATKDEVIDHLKINENKILVTYEGNDCDITSEKKEINKSLGEYFLYVGNAYPHKNLTVLIEGFKKLIKENKTTKLVLVGKIDHFYLKLKGFVKENNLEKEIIFFGKADDSDLFDLYKGALALVTPSLMEGFGLPVLEAMSLNCLVICSDIPVFKEIAKDNALYFNPKSPEELYEKLKKVVLKDFDKKIIEKAYNHSLEFSWKKAAQQTLKIYESSSSL